MQYSHKSLPPKSFDQQHHKYQSKILHLLPENGTIPQDISYRIEEICTKSPTLTIIENEFYS